MESAARNIVRRLRDAGHQALFAGGCVRDSLMGKTPHDFDIATSARPEQVQALFPRTVPVGAQFGVVLVVESGAEYQVATFRSDGAYLDGRHPRSVTFTTAGGRRAAPRLYDQRPLLRSDRREECSTMCRAQTDLETRTLRAIGNPADRFAEDKLAPAARRALCLHSGLRRSKPRPGTRFARVRRASAK